MNEGLGYLVFGLILGINALFLLYICMPALDRLLDNEHGFFGKYLTRSRTYGKSGFSIKSEYSFPRDKEHSSAKLAAIIYGFLTLLVCLPAYFSLIGSILIPIGILYLLKG